MFSTNTAPEFAEGTIDFAADSWFCIEHSATVAIGRECGFCVYESVGPVEFEKWAARNS